MNRLDPLYVPLSGFNLIEASAGTGKTYTLTALHVRLVVELGIAVNRILVVTYTNAATKELRDRIRGRLLQVRTAFLRGRADPEDELAVRLLDLQPDRDIAIRRLTNAVRGFDEAAIFTIHGFCQRALGDHAFASGLAFETELLADTGELLQNIVDDFWRRELYPAAPMVAQYFLDAGHTPERLRSQIERHLNKPYLRIITPGGVVDGAALADTFATAFRQARELWQTDRAVIEDLLLTWPGLNRRSYGLKYIPGWLVAMDGYLSGEIPKLALFSTFNRFTTTKLQTSMNQGNAAPEHPFFAICDTLYTSGQALAEYYRHQLPVKLLAYCNAELAIRKRQQQVQSYDDLLLNLHQALHRPRQGAALAETLRQRYAAALIDEFQDTDPVQYAIFRRIYTGAHQPVFLVGDPKQAIYSFRGADIFAYLNARHDTPATHRYTLDVNWRSDPRLLTALNALFGAAKDQPFLVDEIPFHPALPAERKLHQRLTIQGRTEPPLQLWLLTDGSEPFNKGMTGEWVAQATAAEIARLLNLGARHEARLGDRALTGGDMAVLVRSHWQGRLIRQQLLRLNVPSVQHADASVFTTPEARQLDWLLAAVLEPGHEGRVRTALASDLFGLSGEALHRLHEDERAWAQWLEKLQDYRQLWREHGFIRFFRAWLIAEGIPQRLLAFRDGERRLTNLLHLAELTHVASRSHPGMAGLLKWLGDRRRNSSNQDEEQQLRLESDEHLVRIVTVHKSKGLEYPITFCPFLWDGRLRTDEQDDVLLYHDPENPGQTLLTIGAAEDDPAHTYARHEEMAESLRLFYVALTRAQQRCTLVWGKIKSGETAPPAWLLHRPTVKEPGKDWLQATAERFGKLTGPALRQEVHTGLAPAGETVAITALPLKVGEPYQPPVVAEPQLTARSFARYFEYWRVGSFTALTATRHAADLAELPDYDVNAAAPVVEVVALAGVPVARDISSFPRGARSGTCLHAIFERLDFSRGEREPLEKLVRRTLTGHGLDAEAWTPIVADWVQQILTTSLDESGLQLATVTPERRINELEFYYPLVELRVEALRQILAQQGYAVGPLQEMLDRLQFSPVRGYMKGFIDLVFESGGRFYLVDYKSNWLGAEPVAYRQESLTDVMARESYVLQYLIYTVAVHRYLQLRVAGYDYDRHFGGVYYLFLRGMNPASGAGYGVFHDRPAPALIMALDELMAGK